MTRTEAARWLRSASQRVLEQQGAYLDVVELWRRLKNLKIEAAPNQPHEAVLSTQPMIQESDEMAEYCIRCVRQNRMEDGPRVLVRVLRTAPLFQFDGKSQFGLAEWPTSIHLQFYDQQIHDAVDRGDKEGLEKSLQSLLSLPLEEVERRAYTRIAAEIKRRMEEVE